MAMEWDLRANQVLKKVMMPVVESCFDALSLDGKHLIIDKLEIDLGVFLPGNFEEEAGQRLSQLLSEQLNACRNNGMAHTKEATNPDSPGTLQRSANNTLNGPGMPAAAAQDQPVLVNTAEALYLVLLHFLQQGTLPWWYPPPLTPLADAFPVSWINTLSAGKKSTLQQILLQQPAASTRIVHLFTPACLSEWLEVMHLNGHTAMVQWLLLAPALRIFKGLLPVFHQHFWTNWITASGNNQASLDMPLLLAQTTANDKVLFRQLGEALLTICRQQPVASVFAAYTAAITACLKNAQQAEDNGPSVASTSPDHIGNTGNHTPGNRTNSNITAQEAIIKAQQIMRGLTPAIPAGNKAAGEEPYWHVPDAGIVLLHPFLQELFTSTGLWKIKDWCTEQAPWQAVQLLGYLINGEQELPEYELTLSKILTGLEIATALPATRPLPDSAFIKCNELLEAIVTHWKALRSTSPQGLQEAFLQRHGKLTQVNNGYMLQVAQKAQDALLTHLPWGFATVKLPWMNTILHVTWH
jgi:hypothetical protein